MEEAIDLIATSLESFAFYYYVQRRGLVHQEVKMFENNFCFKREYDWVSIIFLLRTLSIIANAQSLVALRSPRSIHT